MYFLVGFFLIFWWACFICWFGLGFFTIPLLSGNQNSNPESFNVHAKLENSEVFEVC